MKKFSFLMALLFVAVAEAKTMPAPGSVGISGEWLYFRAGIDNALLAQEFGPNGFGGNQHFLDQEWHSGCRAEINYRFCDACSGIILRGTWLPEFRNTKTLTGNLVVTFGDGAPQATEIDGRHTINFYNIELLYAHDIVNCNNFYFSVQPGLQFAHLHFDAQYNAALVGGGFDSNHYTTKRNGIGPELCTEFMYFFNPAFSAQMRVTGALLVAQMKSDWRETDGTVRFLTDDTVWSFLPTVDARLGLNYCRPFRCLAVNIEIGYEFLYYFDAIGQFFAFDSRIFYSNFGAHGPYIQLGVTF